MSEKFIMQMRPWFGEEEKIAINEYMEEDGFITEFKRTEKFEEMLAEFIGVKHCIVVNNGTISLTLAAISVGIKAGDEVIVPNYTMIATPNSVVMLGAKPVFVDVERDTLCLDLSKVKKSITPKTKAIMLVTANGRYPNSDIREFEDLCKQRNITLIEDSAQSLGSYYKDGRHMGTAGLVGSLSFSAPKIISTGQGGAIITNNDNVANKVRKLKDFGRSEGGIDIHDSIGFNFKFTELQACIGIEQVRKLKSRILRKKEILKLYKNKLRNTKEVKFFDQDVINTTPWFIDVVVEKRSELQSFLLKNKIQTRVMYPPINKQKAYNMSGDFPVAELIGKNGLWLPSATQLLDEDIERICSCVKNFYAQVK